MNWFEIEFILLKHLKLQPSELDRMEFYRAEYLLHFFKEFSEREKEQSDKEYKKQDSSLNAKNMLKQNMPKFNSSNPTSALKKLK